MKELVEKVNQLVAEFLKDAEAQIENGNKAAGTRARKASLEIEKSMKEFRKASLEASKKYVANGAQLSERIEKLLKINNLYS